jgi:site-specific DNA recombinase
MTKNETDYALFEQFLPRKAKEIKDSGVAYALVYTRVSSREQFEKNGSIESQEKLCTRLAEQMNIPILKRFGGCFESAKSEERRQFQKMMEFIRKSKENIKYIIVSDNDRFSRTGANAIYLAEQLRKKGIQIVASSSPMDTMTSIGAFQQNIQLLFSHFDNQMRREKTIRGMTQKFEKGYYIGAIPMGYDRTHVDGQIKIVKNKTGEAITKAFKWKAERSLRTSEISKRLHRLGVDIHEKQLSAIFRNVFYCGLLSNKMLKGKIVEGTNWEPLVSQQTFLGANAVLNQFHTPHDHHKEDDNVPLRRFVACAKCGSLWTGYVVQKKGIYYYKCNTKGCKCNVSAIKMHAQFLLELQKYELGTKKIEPLKKQLALTFQYMNQELFKRKDDLEKRRADIHDKILKAEEKYIEDDLDKESLQRYKSKYEAQLAEIAKEEQQLQNPLSNSDKLINYSVEMCQKLSQLWVSNDLTGKIKLQKMIFPEGVEYDLENRTYRTRRVNTLILQIAQLARVSDEKKARNSASEEQNSARVAPSRIELLSKV